MVPPEYAAHTHAMFWTGMVLSPLLLQGWIPSIATFLNTPAWTMSAESFYYLVFPWMAKWKRPVPCPAAPAEDGRRMDARHGSRHALHRLQSGRHRPPDRWSYGPWLQALKYTPLPHLASFVFGVMLASLDELIGPLAAASASFSASSVSQPPSHC